MYAFENELWAIAETLRFSAVPRIHKLRFAISVEHAGTVAAAVTITYVRRVCNWQQWVDTGNSLTRLC